MLKRDNVLIFYFLTMILVFAGCVSSAARIPGVYSVPQEEAGWIRNAEPIEFENELWYPVDDVENLLDEEMLPVGDYRSVNFFVEKKDIKPYERLYTKFGKHKYRVFERAIKK